jgi:UDP-N-acetylmuramoyl-L-alanyl-D-glutamate--2,6-diaminopimelate ligase
MGSLAARKSDFFLITSDDPGDEDPAAIAHQIEQGVPPGTEFGIELDRRAAIRRLLQRARPGDAVLLAGKGHERRMVVADQRLPWNDAEAAADALAELGLGSQPVP